MKVGSSNGRTHPPIIAEASAWFIEFRAGDVNGEARARFIEWLRRSPEHIHAYLEISGVWAELPASDPEGKIDIAALVARARGEPDVIALSSGGGRSPPVPSAAKPRAVWPLRRAAAALAAVLVLAVVTVLFLDGSKFSGSYSTGIGEQ